MYIIDCVKCNMFPFELRNPYLFCLPSPFLQWNGLICRQPPFWFWHYPIAKLSRGEPSLMLLNVLASAFKLWPTADEQALFEGSLFWNILKLFCVSACVYVCVCMCLFLSTCSHRYPFSRCGFDIGASLAFDMASFLVLSSTPVLFADGYFCQIGYSDDGWLFVFFKMSTHAFREGVSPGVQISFALGAWLKLWSLTERPYEGRRLGNPSRPACPNPSYGQMHKEWQSWCTFPEFD